MTCLHSWMFRTKPENNELLVRFKIHIQGITKMLECSSEGPHFKIHKFKSIWSTDSDRDFFFKKIPNSWEGLGELPYWQYHDFALLWSFFNQCQSYLLIVSSFCFMASCWFPCIWWACAARASIFLCSLTMCF